MLISHNLSLLFVIHFDLGFLRLFHGFVASLLQLLLLCCLCFFSAGIFDSLFPLLILCCLFYFSATLLPLLLLFLLCCIHYLCYIHCLCCIHCLCYLSCFFFSFVAFAAFPTFGDSLIFLLASLLLLCLSFMLSYYIVA